MSLAATAPSTPCPECVWGGAAHQGTPPGDTSSSHPPSPSPTQRLALIQISAAPLGLLLLEIVVRDQCKHSVYWENQVGPKLQSLLICKGKDTVFIH